MLLTKKIFFILSVFSFFISCSILPTKNDFHITQQQVELGLIGQKYSSFKNTKIEIFGVPKYKNKLKTTIVFKNLDKKSYKKYIKSNKNLYRKSIIKINDSTINKYKIIEISIEDKVSIVNALNSDNKNIIEYLKKTPKAFLISSIRLISDLGTLNSIQNADSFYLKTDKHKKQWLLLFKNEKEIEKLSLTKNNIFEYKLSHFCWKLTPNRTIVLATILNEKQRCRISTKKNIEKLKKESHYNYFKF